MHFRERREGSTILQITVLQHDTHVKVIIIKHRGCTEPSVLLSTIISCENMINKEPLKKNVKNKKLVTVDLDVIRPLNVIRRIYLR